MKLSNVFAKLTGGKVKVLGAMGGVFLAGAAFTAAAPAANAQVTFGVAIGGPRYYAPAPRPVYRSYGYGYVAPGYVAPGYVAPGYVGPGYVRDGYAPNYWEQRRVEDWRAREWREHEEWEHHRDWDRDRDRDRHSGDRDGFR